MKIERRAVTALRVMLHVLLAVLLLVQVMSIPGQFAHMAQEHPDQAHLRWPLTALLRQPPPRIWASACSTART